MIKSPKQKLQTSIRTGFLKKFYSFIGSLALLRPDPSNAAWFQVDTTQDTEDANPGDGICSDSAGRCSVRAAVEEANSLSGLDTITIPAGSYKLTLHRHLEVSDRLMMNGSGKFSTNIDGDNSTPVFYLVGDIGVFINNLTIQNSSSSPTNQLSAAFNVSPEVFCRLTKVDIKNNVSWGLGGGIRNDGELYLHQVAVSRNSLPTGSGGGQTSQGGGIFNVGVLRIYESEISENVAVRGAGISNVNDGIVSIRHSTISGNTANGAGGGIRNVVNGKVFINFCTITKNKANAPGASGESNRYGGGIYNSPIQGAVTYISNSIIAGNDDNRWRTQDGYGPDCYNEAAGGLYLNIHSRLDNIVGIKSDNCKISVHDPNQDLFGTPENPVDPLIYSVLASNGGLTRSHRLLAGSPAINGDANINIGLPRDDKEIACVDPENGNIDVDQRGLERMIGGACDIGAYEAPASLAFAEWEPNESVEVGDMMTFEDAAWRVVIPHTTFTGWEPPKVPALFVRVPDPGHPWAPGVMYEAGDEVMYNGELYKVVVGHQSLINWVPPLSSLFELIPDPKTEWHPGVAYELGDTVVVDGTSYVVIQAHTSQVGWEPYNVPALWQML